MITDEERREVAAKLRKTLYIPGLPGEWWVRVHKAVTGSENCMCPPEDIAVIADLIDRPTCHLIEDKDGRTACSECGCAALYMSDATYCPDCGGMIVND